MITLLEPEKVVLEIVQEYIEKHGQFEIVKVVPFINSRLRSYSIDLNYKGIRSVLKALVKKNLLVEGSRITIKDILENEKRRKIYDYVLKRPGAHFWRITKDLHISNHVVVWHLNMLMKFDLIEKTEIDNHEVYFGKNVDIKTVEASYFIQHGKSQAIIHYLKDNNIGTTKTQISSDLRMHMNTISKYLDILEDFKLVSKERIDQKTLYFLTEET